MLASFFVFLLSGISFFFLSQFSQNQLKYFPLQSVFLLPPCTWHNLNSINVYASAIGAIMSTSQTIHPKFSSANCSPGIYRGTRPIIWTYRSDMTRHASSIIVRRKKSPRFEFWQTVRAHNGKCDCPDAFDHILKCSRNARTRRGNFNSVGISTSSNRSCKIWFGRWDNYWIIVS